MKLEKVEEHRELECPLYDCCLDLAAKGFWEGFSCKGCGLKGKGEKEKI